MSPCLVVHIAEGPVPVDGSWRLQPEGAGTSVEFAAEGPLNGVMRLLSPIISRVMSREFAGCHENPRRQLDSGG